MATLNVKLELISRGFGTPSKIRVRDRIRTTNPSQGLSRISVTNVGGDNIILPSADVERFVYIRHLGLNSSGARYFCWSNNTT